MVTPSNESGQKLPADYQETIGQIPEGSIDYEKSKTQRLSFHPRYWKPINARTLRTPQKISPIFPRMAESPLIKIFSRTVSDCQLQHAQRGGQDEGTDNES